MRMRLAPKASTISVTVRPGLPGAPRL